METEKISMVTTDGLQGGMNSGIGYSRVVKLP